MPPQLKRARGFTYESLKHDIESSELTPYQYEQLIELIEERSKAMESVENVQSIRDNVLPRLLKEYQEKLEEYDEDDEDNAEERSNNAKMVTFLKRVEILEATSTRTATETDRYEGDLSYKWVHRLKMSYNNYEVIFSFVLKRSNYGGEVSTTSFVRDKSGNKVSFDKYCLKHWEMEDPDGENENIGNFINSCFQDLHREADDDFIQHLSRECE